MEELHFKANVKTVNGNSPDENGNVNVKEYSHPTSGVTAGTYRSVTVNAQGHVTGGSNPTLAIADGGTGATTAKQARENLELGNMALEDNAIVNASISGKVITLTFADGTTKTLTTQDTSGYHTGNATSIGGASATKPAVVVTSYRSGTSWYRVWSDGWIEQGGYFEKERDTALTVTFLKPYADENYTLTDMLARYNGSMPKLVTKTTTGFTMITNSWDYDMYWRTEGKGA